MKKLYFLFVLIFFLNDSANAQHQLHCSTFGSPPISMPIFNQIGYWLDGNPAEYNGCQLNPAITVAVIDSNCGIWNTCDHNFGQANLFTLNAGQTCGGIGTGTCRNRPEYYFIFRFSNAIQMDSMSSMLNQVPNGFYILAYTWFTYEYSMVPAFKQAFQNIGAVSIASLPDTVPYIFFIKKGDPTSLVEVSGVLQSDAISLTQNINCTATGIEELKNNSISIFPNPVSDFISLSKINNFEYNWKIYNVIGQNILEGKLSGSDQQINTSPLSAGLYFLELKNENTRLEIRFVKQ